jgi:hypothetical protein
MWPLAAREDPHRGGPCLQLVPGRALAQQPGQPGDVRFLDPAGPVRALAVAAGVIGAALADLAAGADGGLPRLGRDQPQRCLLPLAQRPAGGVGQLIAAAGGELVQVPDQVVAGPGPIGRDHQLPPEGRRERGDRRVCDGQVVSGGVRARSIQASGSPPVLSHTASSGQAIALEVRLRELLIQPARFAGRCAR